MGTEAGSWMEIDTMEKARRAEGQLSNGSEPEKPRLTFELVSQYFCMPIKQAARELNVGQTALKERCREFGIPRWPGRRLRSLEKVIGDVKVLRKGDSTEMVVQMLQERKKLLEERPDVELDKETKEFIQACYKENCRLKRKKKLDRHEARDIEALIQGAATLQRMALVGHSGGAATGATPMLIRGPGHDEMSNSRASGMNYFQI